MNPKQVFENRTARLVREASSPVYTSQSGRYSQTEQDIIEAAENFTGPDFCHVCGRITDHFGEHSDAQLLEWAKSPKGFWMMED